MNKFWLILSLALVVIPLIQSQNNEFGIDWTYKDQDNWSKKWDTCGGRQQSPINIKTKQMRQNSDLRLDLSSYDTPRNVIFKNIRGSADVSLDPNSTTPMVIYVGKDKVPFVFQNMHFHWGSTRYAGSEHSIDGQQQQAEIHFVHFNQKYKTFKEAKNKVDGVVFIGLLLKYSEDWNRALSPLIGKTPQIETYGSQIKVDNFNFGKVLPKRDYFYSYEGSLTTPPCLEIVTWFLFAEMSIIGMKQTINLRQLKDKNGEQIFSNVRKIQSINMRAVEYKGNSNTFFDLLSG